MNLRSKRGWGLTPLPRKLSSPRKPKLKVQLDVYLKLFLWFYPDSTLEVLQLTGFLSFLPRLLHAIVLALHLHHRHLLLLPLRSHPLHPPPHHHHLPPKEKLCLYRPMATEDKTMNHCFILQKQMQHALKKN